MDSLHDLGCWNGEEKSRTLPGPGLDPDAAAMPLDDPLSDREADAGAWILVAAVQPLENHKDAIEVLRLDADPVVADTEQPVSVLLGRGNVHLRSRRTAEFQRVRDQVEEHVLELALIRRYDGELIPGNDRAGVFDGQSEIREGTIEYGSRVRGSELRSTRADAGIREQIFDQPLHADRAVQREADELVGVGVQLSFIALAQQLAVVAHHPQRRLELGLCYIRAWARLRLRGPQVHLGPLTRADVHDRREHELAFVRFDRVQADLDRHFSAVATHPELIPPRAHGAGLWILEEVHAKHRMPGPQPLRDQHLDRLTEQLVAPVVEQSPDLPIDQPDLAGGIDHHHAAGGRLDGRAKARGFCVLPEWTGQTAGDHPCAGCADHHQDEGERGEAFDKTAGGCEHVGARFLDDDDPRRPRYARRARDERPRRAIV